MVAFEQPSCVYSVISVRVCSLHSLRVTRDNKLFGFYLLPINLPQIYSDTHFIVRLSRLHFLITLLPLQAT